MPLRRTSRKSETVALWLRSITASSPCDARSGGGGAIHCCGGAGAGGAAHPAVADAARPERTLLREIIPKPSNRLFWSLEVRYVTAMARRDPSRRTVLKAATALAGAAVVPETAIAQAPAITGGSESSFPSPDAPGSTDGGYNILFILTDQERYMGYSWPVPLP